MLDSCQAPNCRMARRRKWRSRQRHLVATAMAGSETIDLRTDVLCAGKRPAGRYPRFNFPLEGEPRARILCPPVPTRRLCCLTATLGCQRQASDHQCQILIGDVARSGKFIRATNTSCQPLGGSSGLGAKMTRFRILNLTRLRCEIAACRHLQDCRYRDFATRRAPCLDRKNSWTD